MNTTVKRLFTTAGLLTGIAVFGCALFFSCGEPVDENTPGLRWRSAITIPVNMSIQLKDGLGQIHILDSILRDFGKDNIPVGSDIIDILKRFTGLETDYVLSMTNGTDVNITLYALLFKAGDDAADMTTNGFYNLLTTGKETEPNRYVNLLGRGGFLVSAHESKNFHMPSNHSAPLCNLVMTSDSLMWRWLVKVSSADSDILQNNDGDANSIHASLRLTISGVNSFDSLLAK